MKKQEQGQGLYYRSFRIDAKAIDEKKRSIDISFSSEDPHKSYSWCNPEILLHGDENVDLSYIESLGSVLMNHQPCGPGMPVEIIGKPENVRIENKIGRATIIFDTDEKSEGAFQKVLSGSLRGVSVGAQIRAVTVVEAGEEFQGHTGPVDLATLWRPVEISLTPIPADGTVGVNKSLGEFADEFKSGDTKKQTEENQMDGKEVKKIVGDVLKGLDLVKASDVPKTDDIVKAVRLAIVEDAKPQMRITSEQALDITGRAAAVSLECKSLISDMILNGKNETECLKAITDQAVLDEDPDNKDKGGLLNGTGIKDKDNKGADVISFKSLGDTDDAFIQGLTNPTQFSFAG